MPNRQLEAAARARVRELHLQRLADISGRRPSVPPPPPKMPAARKLSHPDSTRIPPRPPNTAVALEASLEQASHRRKLLDISRGVERARAHHAEAAQAAGRAHISSQSGRRTLQRQVALENQQQRLRLQRMQPRLASPAEIALLTGKGGAGGAAGLAAATTPDDDDED